MFNRAFKRVYRFYGYPDCKHDFITNYIRLLVDFAQYIR